MMHAYTSSWNVAPQTAPAHHVWGAYHKPAELCDITNQQSRFGSLHNGGANNANANGGPRRSRFAARKPVQQGGGQPSKDHPRRSAPHPGGHHGPRQACGLSLSRAAAPVDPNAVETDPHKISQRMKQIFFGKNTIGYQLYLEQVRKEDRVEGNDKHAQTPRADQLCSKRSWDLQVKKWRRTLHLWDPPELDGAQPYGEEAEEMDDEEDDASDTENTLASRTSSNLTAPRSLSIVSASDGDLRRCNSHSWASDGSDEPDFSDLSDFQF